jgi:hypothetical protein
LTLSALQAVRYLCDLTLYESFVELIPELELLDEMAQMEWRK